MDLVEISPKADPPVVRIIDFKKFKYEEARKERSARKKTKKVETKEIWLGPLISEHDLEIRLSHAKAFLTNGDRVKLTVKFGGREIAHPEFGYKILDKSVEKLSDIAQKDSEARFIGRKLSLSLNPAKVKKNETKDNKNS